MNRVCLCLMTFMLLMLACKKHDMPDPGPKDPTDTTKPKPTETFISVTTQHNNNYRTGWNDHETKLNINNVNAQQFGKLFSLAVDDDVFAQPLVVANVSVNGGVHNVVYVATVNNSVYAFDADKGDLIWQKNFTVTGMRPPSNADLNAIGACGGHYLDFLANFGIVGTPVIDSTSQTMYFVARSTDGTNFLHNLHAVNLLTGGDVSGSPVQIAANYPGHGDGTINDSIPFNGLTQNQRQGLTLVDGRIYVTFASHCDVAPYHGWIFGYDSKTLEQQIVYNTTPEGGGGGIWESGMGPAVDESGNLYVAVGNGSSGVVGDPNNNINRGESAVKLSVSGSTLSVSSFFSPYNFEALNSVDHDFGSLGSLLIPNSNYYFTGVKGGDLYLLDRDNMGGFQNSLNQIQQSISLNLGDEHSQATYYKGATNEFVYVWSENNPLHAFPFNRSTYMMDLDHLVTATTSGPTGTSGSVLSVSSNGSVDSTAILWAAFGQSGCDAGHDICPGVLYAFSASDVTKEIWSSQSNQADAVASYAKFSTPTIVNGHVYLATFSKTVEVYGLKSTD